jgi:gamma-glutamyltranspeptidase / glutathione hydrolase
MLAEFGTLSLARGAGAGHRAGRRLRDRGADRQRDRTSEGRDRDSGRTRRPCSSRTPGRRAKRRMPARSSGSPIWPRPCANSSRRNATALTAGRSRKDGDPGRVRPLLQGRHRTGDRTRDARAGWLFTTDDLASWRVKLEEPVSTTYKGIEVFKLAQWQQGPVMLQALNILEPLDLSRRWATTARATCTRSIRR